MKFELDNMVVMKDTNVEKYAFISITKEQYEIFDSLNAEYNCGKITLKDYTELFGYSPYAFVLHGKTNEANSDMLYHLIESCTVKESETNPLRLSYKCFCGEGFGLDYRVQVLHGSALDSWNCLMTYCNNPEYGIVVNLRYV